MVKKCHECKYHYLLWDWDNFGHHSRCLKYNKPIPCPSRFDYPVKTPKWCEEGKHDKPTKANG